MELPTAIDHILKIAHQSKGSTGGESSNKSGCVIHQGNLISLLNRLVDGTCRKEVIYDFNEVEADEGSLCFQTDHKWLIINNNIISINLLSIVRFIGSHSHFDDSEFASRSIGTGTGKWRAAHWTTGTRWGRSQKTRFRWCNQWAKVAVVCSLGYWLPRNSYHSGCIFRSGLQFLGRYFLGSTCSLGCKLMFFASSFSGRVSLSLISRSSNQQFFISRKNNCSQLMSFTWA